MCYYPGSCTCFEDGLTQRWERIRDLPCFLHAFQQSAAQSILWPCVDLQHWAMCRDILVPWRREFQNCSAMSAVHLLKRRCQRCKTWGQDKLSVFPRLRSMVRRLAATRSEHIHGAVLVISPRVVYFVNTAIVATSSSRRALTEHGGLRQVLNRDRGLNGYRS